MRKMAVIIALVMGIAIASVGTRNKATYRIEIYTGACKLILYTQQPDKTWKIVRSYSVATAKKGLRPIPMGPGTITQIEFDPWWYPTPDSREFFKESKGIMLPEKVPPGHPLNHMGTFKLHLSHFTSKGTIYRIHGNNDETLIGKRVTGGCIRMRNKEGEKLGRMVHIGTEVLILP